MNIEGVFVGKGVGVEDSGDSCFGVGMASFVQLQEVLLIGLGQALKCRFDVDIFR